MTDLFEKKNSNHELVYFKEPLSKETAHLAKDFDTNAIFISTPSKVNYLYLLIFLQLTENKSIVAEINVYSGDKLQGRLITFTKK